jgi:hypothetical protein
MTSGVRTGTARHPWLTIVAALVPVALAGCGVSNLAFATDDRLTFSAPAKRALVSQPVTLQWRVKGFAVRPAGTAPPKKSEGYFGIFLDRAPIRPGRTLRDVAHGDKTCRPSDGCPSPQYLADRGVYTTIDSTYELRRIAALNNHERTQLHEATIVLLDTAGRRVGEGAWYVDFRLRRA